MSKYALFLAMWIVAGLLTAQTLSGQQVSDTEASLLPEIDPQDIEIRSQYRARFPGLRRQPILGFTPGSRVFQVDPGRTPWLEELEDIAARLPVGELERPDAPEFRTFPFADQGIGYGRLGFGRFNSPEALFHTQYEAAEDHWLSGTISHHSSGGHLAQQSGFRYFDNELNYRGKVSDRTLLGAFVDLNSDFNYLPGIQTPATDLSELAGRKDYRNVATGMRLVNYQTIYNKLNAGFEARYSTIDVTNEPLAGDAGLNEWGLSADADYTWTGERIHELFSIRSDLHVGGYELMGGESHSWHLIGAWAGYQRMFNNYRTRIDARLGLQHAGDPEEPSAFYFAPELQGEHDLTSRIMVSASVKGEAEHPGHMELHTKNRFLLPQHSIRHSYHLEGKMELVIEMLPYNKIRAGASYRQTKNHPYFSRQQISNAQQGSEITTGYYVLQYGNASIPRAWAGVSVDLSRDNLWFDLEGYMQWPEFTNGQEIPFTESYGVRGGVNFRPIDRVHIEGWGNLSGPRKTAEGDDLPAYFILGGKAEVRLTDRVGVYGKAVNLLNESYELWQGFEERPLQIYGGVLISF